MGVDGVVGVYYGFYVFGEGLTRGHIFDVAHF